MLWITHSRQFLNVNSQDKGVFFFDSTELLMRFVKGISTWTCLEVYCLSPELTISIVSRKRLVCIRSFFARSWKCDNVAVRIWKHLSFSLCSDYRYLFLPLNTQQISPDISVPSQQLLDLFEAIYPGLLGTSQTFLNVQSRRRLEHLLWDFVFLVSEDTNERMMKQHFPSFAPLFKKQVPRLVQSATNNNEESFLFQLLLSDPLVQQQAEEGES